ncbi:MAG: EAL domain-containing protein [Pseudomonadota bacterium]
MDIAVTNERERFLTFAFAAADVLIELDANGDVVYATGATPRILDGGSLVGSRFVDLFVPADRALLAYVLGELAEGGRRGPVDVTAAATAQCGACSLIRTPGSDRTRAVLCGLKARRNAAADANRDPRTGLLDAEAFREMAERELRLSVAGEEGLQLSMVRLTGIENLSGAPLQGLLDSVAASLRAISANGNAAACVGAGRFALLHEEGAGGDHLNAQLQTTVRAFDGISGVGSDARTMALEPAGLSPDQACAALRHVLDQLERATEGGLGTGDLADALSERLAGAAARVSAARSLIKDGGFYLVYQPIVSLEDGLVHHSEALARLTSKENVFEFVRFAEEVGFITDFDLAVSRSVLDSMGKLSRGGLWPHVAVNLSARSLQSDAFVERILRLYTGAGSIVRQLMIEVTESYQIADLERANAILQTFRTNGMRVCLDDFGAGAAAFHYIRGFDVDYVKLDGAFVQGVCSSERDAAVLRSMVDLCRSVKTATIAEMVESAEQAALLRDFGVTLGQGFHFGRPASEPSPSPGAPETPIVRVAARRKGTTESWG